jgi:GDP-L-fucose synthase
VGYKGKIFFDPSKPDGTQKKLLDISLIRSLGWSQQIDIQKGLKITYQDFLNYD